MYKQSNGIEARIRQTERKRRRKDGTGWTIETQSKKKNKAILSSSSSSSGSRILFIYMVFPPRARKNDSTDPIIMKGMCRIRRLQIGHVQQQQQRRRSTRDRENRQVKMISILDD
jgi:hypothetical protein